jgi:extracellular factor (EF) 3-hydroxypalmitic acid methyl ester biosynthesis protein
VQQFEEVSREAREFVETAERISREISRGSSSIPGPDQQEAVNTAFWRIWPALQRYLDSTDGNADHSVELNCLLGIIGPTLWKSVFYSRGYFKPNGISGDYKMVEMMYDLEERPGRDPCRSPMENLLEGCFATIHSVVAIWERRHWIAGKLASAYKRSESLRIADIACGGARYVFDAIERLGQPESLRATLFDQDISAIGFLKNTVGERRLQGVDIIHGRISDIGSHLIDHSTYDAIVSAGMYDYLEPTIAIRMTRHLAMLLKDGGRLYVTNYHKNDPSRLPKVWGSKWHLVFRDEEDMREIATRSKMDINIEYSKNGCLMMCEMKK